MRITIHDQLVSDFLFGSDFLLSQSRRIREKKEYGKPPRREKSPLHPTLVSGRPTRASRYHLPCRHFSTSRSPTTTCPPFLLNGYYRLNRLHSPATSYTTQPPTRTHDHPSIRPNISDACHLAQFFPRRRYRAGKWKPPAAFVISTLRIQKDFAICPLHFLWFSGFYINRMAVILPDENAR